LRQVGRLVFTLPICLRKPTSPGYPPSDKEAYEYFQTVTKKNDFTAHIDIAIFLAAAHTTMLTCLKKKREEGLNGQELLGYWHWLMEQQEGRHGRSAFFVEVVKLTKLVSRDHLASCVEIPDLSTDQSESRGFA